MPQCALRMHHSNICHRNDLFFLYGGAPNGRIKPASRREPLRSRRSAHRKVIHYLFFRFCIISFFIFTVAESQPIIVSAPAELTHSSDPPVSVGQGPPIMQHRYYTSHPTDAIRGQQYQGQDQSNFNGLNHKGISKLYGP